MRRRDPHDVYFVVPDTLENRPEMFFPHKNNGDRTVFAVDYYVILSIHYFGLFCDINEELDLYIDTYEEEEVPLEKLPRMLEMVQKYYKKTKDKKKKAVLDILISAINLAIEKKTLLALFL